MFSKYKTVVPPHVSIEFVWAVKVPKTLTLQVGDLDATTTEETTDRSKDYRRLTFHYSPSGET